MMRIFRIKQLLNLFLHMSTKGETNKTLSKHPFWKLDGLLNSTLKHSLSNERSSLLILRVHLRITLVNYIPFDSLARLTCCCL